MMMRLLPLALLLCASLCYGYSIDQQKVESEFVAAEEEEKAQQEPEENVLNEYAPLRNENEDNTEESEEREGESSYENSWMAVMNQAWMTNLPKTAFRQSFEYVCAPGSALSHMYSIHSNLKEDRQWQFKCRKLSTSYQTVCRWTAPHNFDYPLNAKCSAGEAVTGFRSLRYSTFHRDRQYSARCCKMAEVDSSCCKTTGFINQYDGVLNYQANANKIITGIYSVHHNLREDRIFKITYCDINGKVAPYDCSC